MNKRLQRLQNIFRRMGVLPLVESARFRLKSFRTRKANRVFVKNNPDFVLPPEHLAFDAHGHVNWDWYKEDGARVASQIVRTFQEMGFVDGMSIFEWGCGPGRVIRYMPELLVRAKMFASDYNAESIRWCSENLKGVAFFKNELDPPLPVDTGSFDALYAISVFTHLSQEVCLRWIAELERVLKPGGLLMIWTNGDAIAEYLLPEEMRRYEQGMFVSRDGYEEGKKMFLSFHPPVWVRHSLLKRFEILQHLSGGFSGGAQDIWIARKPVGTAS